MTDIDNRHLEILEDLPFRADDAWYVLLVYLGLKSGAWVDIQSGIWREGEASMKVPESTLRHIEASLSELGLTYSIETRETDAGLWQPEEPARKRMQQIVDIYVAKDQAALNDILLARTTNDHKRLGLALGYPKTAVETFGTDNSALVSSLSPKVQLSETGQLTFFALSKDNWEEELATVEEWVKALKDTSSIMWHALRRFANVVDDEFIDLAIESRK